MDAVDRRRIKEASRMAKRKVEGQVLSMKWKEFASSLKGGEAFSKSVNAIFRDELRTLHQIQDLYEPVSPP